ncbi:TetR/AcrR family transcriptional regulator [Catenulispora sp. EB89]|uniref:TetR/AcrR family transcriptional regulator n=1 Tax=Catenulispora sp. EB89 TaxID=3156257 RepID=UPI0035132F57
MAKTKSGCGPAADAADPAGADAADGAAESAARDAQAVPTIWERIDVPRGTRTSLSHERIAEAAIALADAEGLDAVSMRKLAESLGVATMALYRYVNSKDELLELMTDAVGTASELVADPNDWRAVFREAARRRRDTTLAHPWLPAAQAQVPTSLTPNRNLALERMLAALEPLSLTGDQKMRLIRALDSYARGATDGEVNQRTMLERRGYGADGDVRLLLRSNMQWLLRSGRYPLFSQLVLEGLAPVDAEAEFELGLEAMLDGLAARFGI